VICRNCYFRGKCGWKPNSDDRCHYFLKNGAVRLTDGRQIDVLLPDLDEGSVSEPPDKTEKK
jgi:hypothetical protein